MTPNIQIERRPARQDTAIGNIRGQLAVPPEKVQDVELDLKDLIYVSPLDEEVVEEEEANLNAELQGFSMNDQGSKKSLKDMLTNAELHAKRRLIWQAKEQDKAKRIREIQFSQESHQRQILISKTFRKAEETTKNEIRKLKGEVRVSLGKMGENEGDEELDYGGDRRRYKVLWRRRPQPVELRLEQCRSVKDKIPEGEYIILVSLWNRIAGNVIEYRKIKNSTKWKRFTKPKFHSGKHFENSLKFEENLNILAPSVDELHPTMVYTFELFLKKNVQTDAHRVIAYGTFPVCNSAFDIAEGKFKVPLIRGEIDLSMDKFADIDRLYRRNIDEWLCNLYFSIQKTNPLSAGENEYQIRMLPTSKLAEAELDMTTLQTEVESAPEVDKMVKEEKKKEKPMEIIAPEQFMEYKHSVLTTDFVFAENAAIRKFEYIASELQTELGFRSWKHRQMYITLFTLLLMCWLSRYTHYCGQWLFLKGEGVPVTNFENMWLFLDIDYPEDTPGRIELGVIVIGTIFSMG